MMKFTTDMVAIIKKKDNIAGFLFRTATPLLFHFHPNFRGVSLGLDCR